MERDRAADELCSLWQSQGTEVFRMTPADLQRKAERFEAALRRRSRMLYAICGGEIVAFGYFLTIVSNPVQRIGALLTIVGMTFLAYQIWSHQVNMRAIAAAMYADPAVIFYRGLLERSRDFHRGVWFWSRLLAIMPGPLVFTYGAKQADPTDWSHYVAAAAFILFGLLAIPLNVKIAAGKFQKKLDTLDRLTR